KQLRQELQNQRLKIQLLRSDLDASRASVHQLGLRLSSVTHLPQPLPLPRSCLPNLFSFDGKPLILRTWLPSIWAKLRSDQLGG
ncbi:hypothetical protein EJ02DRAFT_311543, partial [Clathrospora elynae]